VFDRWGNGGGGQRCNGGRGIGEGNVGCLSWVEGEQRQETSVVKGRVW